MLNFRLIEKRYGIGGEIGRNNVLVKCFIAMKRHHKQGNSYIEKHLIGTEVQSIIMAGRMAASKYKGRGG